MLGYFVAVIRDIRHVLGFGDLYIAEYYLHKNVSSGKETAKITIF